MPPSSRCGDLTPRLAAERAAIAAQGAPNGDRPRACGTPPEVRSGTIFQVSDVRWRVALLVGGALLVSVVTAAFYTAFHSIGRTPASGFVKDAFGSEAVVFDKAYDGTGSSENRSRTVVLRTPQAPHEVLATIAGKGGWRPLGDGLERESDGLCVVSFSPKDYLSTARSQRGEDVRAVTERGPAAVVLSLLYC